jgi:hypothetical protein
VSGLRRENAFCLPRACRLAARNICEVVSSFRRPRFLILCFVFVFDGTKGALYFLVEAKTHSLSETIQMADAPAANSKPPFMRRRWPFFVLGFLAALPAPNLAWRAFEHALYGGPTVNVTVIEIDRPPESIWFAFRKIGYEGPEIRRADDRTILTRPVRTALPIVDIDIQYQHKDNGRVIAIRAAVQLDRDKGDCYVVVRHRPEEIEISQCMRVVPTL